MAIEESERTAALTGAVSAFIYTYPLEYCMRELGKLPAGEASVLPGVTPFNTFGYARDLLGPEAAFVSPNNDTLYVVAPCDVRGGPLVLRVPDTGGRYYVLQFVDAWSNNFAYVGRRSTGTAAGEFLLVGPGYDGEVPDGATVVEAPTGIFIIVGRIQVDGPDDLETVRHLQDQFTIGPLDADAPAPAGMPLPDPAVDPDLAFWERARVAALACPPPDAEADVMSKLAQMGLRAGASPYVDPDPELRQLLIAAEQAGRQQIDDLMTGLPASPTGWQSALHVFDYNTRSLSVGTIDTAHWKIAEPQRAFGTRAVAARAGLWGNHGYEAAYFLTANDGDGNPLDGSHRYRLVLDPPPPVGAFWSLTMYDVPHYYLVANPIDRYSIGDRTPGLVTATDGSVTLHLQHERPQDAGEAANWLPAPEGAFRPILRMYQPGEPVLDDSYALAAIQRID